MKISICNELFQGWSIERVFDYAAQLGYDGVEISPFTLADSVLDVSPKRREAIRHAAEKSGVKIVGLHWLLVKPEGLYVNHPDEIIRIRTQEYIEALIHFCHLSEENICPWFSIGDSQGGWDHGRHGVLRKKRLMSVSGCPEVNVIEPC
jgi:sugar phosphate isomerase/epimerase